MCIEEIEWKVTACNFGPLDGNKSQRQFVVDETNIFPRAASASGLIDERLILWAPYIYLENSFKKKWKIKNNNLLPAI